jgi:VanZ family protein
MHPRFIVASSRVGTWCCVIALAVLSLLPADEMVRTGFPTKVEHFVAYAGSAAIAMAGYGRSRGGLPIIGAFWVYAALLEYLQRFSPGRHPAIEDVAVSAIGALCGGLAVAFFSRRISRAYGG